MQSSSLWHMLALIASQLLWGERFLDTSELCVLWGKEAAQSLQSIGFHNDKNMVGRRRCHGVGADGLLLRFSPPLRKNPIFSSGTEHFILMWNSKRAAFTGDLGCRKQMPQVLRVSVHMATMHPCASTLTHTLWTKCHKSGSRSCLFKTCLSSRLTAKTKKNGVGEPSLLQKKHKSSSSAHIFKKVKRSKKWCFLPMLSYLGFRYPHHHHHFRFKSYAPFIQLKKGN